MEQVFPLRMLLVLFLLVVSYGFFDIFGLCPDKLDPVQNICYRGQNTIGDVVLLQKMPSPCSPEGGFFFCALSRTQGLFLKILNKFFLTRNKIEQTEHNPLICMFWSSDERVLLTSLSRGPSPSQPFLHLAFNLVLFSFIPAS